MLVDAADLPLISGLTWRAVKTGRSGRMYAVTDETLHGRSRRVWMHRVILGVHGSSRPIVDHIDGNPLNNCRANLRLATAAQNAQNRTTAGRFRGVWRKGDAFIAKVARRYLGTFPTESLAALAYDEEALAVYGHRARLNFPPMPSGPLAERFLRVV